MAEEQPKKEGILGGITALIIAVTGLIIALGQAGVFNIFSPKTPDVVIESPGENTSTPDVVENEEVSTPKITPTPILDNGLLAYYSFDNPEKLGADTSNNGRNGTNIGATSDRQGRKGGAAYFDGKSKIEIEGFRDFRWGSDFTVSVWFKRTGEWNTYQGIVNNGYYTNGSWEIRMEREYEGKMLGGGIVTSSSRETWDYINIQASQNKWHHVVMTYDGERLLFYLDGRRKSTDKDTNISGNIIPQNTPVTIGQAGFGIDSGKDQEHFYGYIDEVRIYERALSYEEVKKLYELDY